MTFRDVAATFIDNLIAAVADPQVWLALLVSLVSGLVVAALGVYVLRVVGLGDRRSTVGERLAVGLAAGLLVVGSVWATVRSGGQSAFSPIAVAFVAAILLSAVRATKARGSRTVGATARRRDRSLRPLGRRLVLPLALGAGFLALTSFTYASTMVPSPRDGVQPVEFMDEAYYSLLGDELARTGTESVYATSGIPTTGTPEQVWYHWGEIWLSSLVIATTGLPPMPARYFVVLPLCLLAVAGMLGAFVRRASGASPLRSFLFAAATTLFLSPVALAGTPFAFYSRGGVFSVTTYGLAALVVVLGASLFSTWRRRPSSPGATIFLAAVVVSLLPVHVTIAVVAAAAALACAGIGLALHLRAREWRPSVATTQLAGTIVVLSAATLAWGVVTGHGFAVGESSAAVASFNAVWWEAVLQTAAWSGVILIIPIMIYRQRRERDLVFWGAVFALLAVGFGAVAWGLGIARYNTFHAFYGAISTIAIPVATVAAVAALRAVRRSRWRWLGPALVIVLVIQLQVGAFATMLRLEELGPNRYPPVPLAVLDAIRALPANAKLAYSCQPMEEITGVWDPMLAGITAHTGRVLVPMCFSADTEAPAMGGVLDRDAPSPDFAFARQRMLFPNASSRPSSEEVSAFLKAHGVHYVYEDDLHPNELVAAGNVVIDMSGHQVLTIR